MLDTAAALKRTPFHPRHVAHGAKMVPFAGHVMPIQYEGILAEHRTVRSSVGVFDVSHMGEIRLTGPGAIAYAQRLVTNEVGKIPEGKVVYTPMCREDGGIVDDLLVYALGADRYLVVNASNFDKDLAWVRAHAPADVSVVDENAQTAQLAVQGPRAEAVVGALYGDRARALGFYEAFDTGSGEDWTLVSRTGYTGEDGFEIYVRPSRALALWDEVFAAGEAEGIRPIGLGARDTLRLEMGYCLYGNDIDETTNPLEAGLGWITKLGKGDFIGRDALLKIKAQAPRRALVGFVVQGDKAFPRHGYDLRAGDSGIGTVTSGTVSPSLHKGIGLGYVASGYAEPGTAIDVAIRSKNVRAQIVKTPFVHG